MKNYGLGVLRAKTNRCFDCGSRIRTPFWEKRFPFPFEFCVLCETHHQLITHKDAKSVFEIQDCHFDGLSYVIPCFSVLYGPRKKDSRVYLLKDVTAILPETKQNIEASEYLKTKRETS